MAERKQEAAATSKPQTGATSAASDAPAGTATGKGSRKAWVKKTPVEHVLDQIVKQEKKVADMREELKKEERELAKLQQAKKLLEAS